MKIIVHPRVHERHPDITDEDVYSAWIGCISQRNRAGAQGTIGAGYDLSGRLLEFIARHDPRTDEWLIYHAMKCTKKTLRELGIQAPHKRRG
ncbi:hypothetical protein [Bifidobacterium vespertilionis]|uniref:Uncharacterized protein n=1 Tax=Bifidobacterium vespertilionis TaxID=2562524 RepID=A0A5J5DTK3_9BIFI|nr:hypothetical protein [Bifidobacterium vespertilionis]KAA8818867.1 hypothetical protein EMO90_09395 [Bifidobacterium vespertilionis]KAA8823001.1 hypothetical protein EM848_07455 [Bifidobacterium vespertilionis]